MSKYRWCSWLFVLLVSLSACQKPSTAGKSQDAELLPAVKQILQAPRQLDPQMLKQDVAVGLLTLDAPQGVDYLAAGSKMVLHNHDLAQQRLKAGMMSGKMQGPAAVYNGQPPLQFDDLIHGEKYRIPCRSNRMLDNYHCARQIIENQAKLTVLARQNQLLLTRYEQIKQLPHWGAYLYNVDDPLPVYQLVMDLSILRFSEGLIAIHAGRADEGFALMSSEMAFIRRMMQQDGTLIGKMVSVRICMDNLSILSSMLDQPSMQPYLNDPRLSALLAPLTEAQQTGMLSALETERNMNLSTLYLSGGTPADEQYDRNAVANIAYQMWQPVLKQASLNMDKASQAYLTEKGLPPLAAEMKRVLDQELASRKAQGKPLSEMGKKILDLSIAPGFESYFRRWYDMQAYLALVRAKQQLFDAGSADVTASLQQLGSSGRNPYTQRPFVWHADKRFLSTDWLDSVNGSKGQMQQMNVLLALPGDQPSQ